MKGLRWCHQDSIFLLLSFLPPLDRLPSVGSSIAAPDPALDLHDPLPLFQVILESPWDSF